MSNNSSTRKHPAAKPTRVLAARKVTGSARPTPRRRVKAKHVGHAAGAVGTAVALETAARLICEHVLPIAMPFLH